MRGFFIACFLLLGCVGDSSTPMDGGMDAKSQGGLAQPCYPNGSCDKPYTCVSSVCVDLSSDATMDAPTDSPVSDSSGDGEAGPMCTNYVQPYVHIAQNCSGTSGTQCMDCAAGAAFCEAPGGTCQSGQMAFQCGSSAECPGGQCCFAPTASSFSATGYCPVSLTYTGSCPPSGGGTMTQCQPVCQSGAFQMCAKDGECPTSAPHCNFTFLNAATFTSQKIGGICQP